MFENVKITKLENGACVATSKMEGVNSCSLHFSVPMGSRREKASEAGWSHFAEHMAFKGSAKYPTGAAIDRALDRIGGMHNASTGSLCTRFETTVPAKWTAKAVDVLGDIVANPIYPAAEIERERKVVFEEINMSQDSPSARISRFAQAAFWPGHPLGRSVIGNEKSLSRIDADALHAFRNRHYTAEGAMFVAAGNLDHDSIVEMARPAFDNLSKGRETAFLPASRCRPADPLAFERRDVKQAFLRILFRPSAGAGAGRRAAMLILAEILGGGMGSRLFKAVRERHGLAYSISSFAGIGVDTTDLSITAEVNAARVEKATALCGGELRKLVEKPVGRREFSDVKNMRINNALLLGEDSSLQRILLEHSLRAFGRVETTAEEIANYKSVTPGEIQSLASEFFRPENCTLAMILPHDCKASPEKLREALFNGWQA